MKFPSPSTRAGFTLLELTIAMGIGAVVLALVANAYLGANKSQSITVATGLIKSSGQQALNEIYKKLHGSQLVFDRNALATSYLAQLPIKGYSAALGAAEPDVVASDVLLPRIQDKAAFYVESASSVVNPDFDRAAVGNSLLFVTREPEAILQEEPSGSELASTFGTDEYELTPYRLHFIAPVRRDLGRAPRVREGTDYTYMLMHWESEPYLDYQDVVQWMQRLKANGVAGSYVNAKLAKLRHPDDGGTGPYVGALDLSAATGGGAIYGLVANASQTDLTPGAGPFKTHFYRTAIKMELRGSFGESMLAFNTAAPSPEPAVPVPGLDVPAFAEDTSLTPYGLEVAIGGAAGYRQVLLRMAVAARTQPGNMMVGQTFQQVVQLSANTIEPPATPTPGPTPTTSSSSSSYSY